MKYVRSFKDLRSMIAFFGFLFFALIGIQWMATYSLWDDEANTALFAQSVKKTGDTSALLGHNIIAFRNGAELNEEQKARYVSPFQYYFLAPFSDPTQPSPFKARLPFFLLTLVSLAWIYRRLIQLNLPTPIVAAFLCLSLGLTSFLLFGVQARYYALTFFFSLWLADQYFFGKLESKRDFYRFGFISSFLFISNYLIGVAALISLFAHYLLIRRGKLRNLWMLLIPHALISVPVFLIWNPLGKTVVEMKNSPLDKLNLFYRCVRDFNGGHLGSLLLLILGMFLFEKNSQKRFKSYALIFFVYLTAIALFSPQPVHGTGQADIRYLYPLMILGFAWSLDFFQLVLQKNKFLFAGTVLFFSFCALPYSGQLRIHAMELFHELSHPADDPYRLIANELNRIQLTNGQHPTLLSSLDYGTYPLMFLSPPFQYIQSETLSAPEYLVEFCDDGLKNALENRYSVHYEKLTSIPSACRETYRPEVYLRTFGKPQFRGYLDIYKKL